MPTAPVSSRAVPAVTFSAQGLSFRYLAAWQSDTWNGEVSSFTSLIVYLSTSRLRDSCMVATNPVDRSVPCAYPLVELPAGGVLVRWDDDGFPGFHLPKPNTTIADRPAAETRTSDDGWCQALGRTETITVMIPRDLPDNWYQMDACLPIPGLPHQEAQISAMLSTVRTAKGDLHRRWRPVHHFSHAT